MYFTLIVMAMATWRLANMLADTDQSGPFEMLDWLRSKAGVRFNPEGAAYGSNNLSEGLICVFCNSVWIGMGFVALFYFAPTWAFYVALPFALSAAAILIEKRL